jgi:hypothetical protein
LRTGNAILDVLVRVVAIALITAIIVWMLGVLDAPMIVGTIIWILALLAIAAVILPLALRGLGSERSDPAERGADPASPRSRLPEDEPTAPTRRPPPPAA